MLTSTKYIVLFQACAATLSPIKLKNTRLECLDALANISFFRAIFLSLHII